MALPGRFELITVPLIRAGTTTSNYLNRPRERCMGLPLRPIPRNVKWGFINRNYDNHRFNGSLLHSMSFRLLFLLYACLAIKICLFIHSLDVSLFHPGIRKKAEHSIPTNDNFIVLPRSPQSIFTIHWFEVVIKRLPERFNCPIVPI